VKRPRCSIWLCPWKARYSFGPMNYYECWYHGGDSKVATITWELLMNLPSFFYRWMRYRVCDGIRGLKWGIDWKVWEWDEDAK
jgi:hypothetical protein